MSSKIEWTDVTWNPLRGCTRVSAGCDHCYAMGIAARFSGPGKPFEGVAKMVHGNPHWTGQIKLVPEKVAEPLRWKKPRTVFVNSMSDLFHEAVPDDYIARVWWVMGQTAGLLPGRYRGHTYQILTKRGERMVDWVHGWCDPTTRRKWIEAMGEVYDWACGPKYWPDVLPNVWMGVSVEDQATADERIPHLLATPAAVRFVSYEPALGPVDFTRISVKENNPPPGPPDPPTWINTMSGRLYASQKGRAVKMGKTERLDWIICGGESGPNARPMHPDWARSVRDQCAAAGVAYFFKQWGAWKPLGSAQGEPLENPEDVFIPEERCGFLSQDGMFCAMDPHNVATDWMMGRVGKKAAGRLLDGVLHDGMPEQGA